MSMPLKKKPCGNWKLYLVTGPETLGRPLEEVVVRALEGGVDVVQLRDKRASDEELSAAARRLLAITRPRGVPLIINDRPSVAKSVGAEGVHLGQEDGPLDAARRALGAEALIGRSTHDAAQALAAQREGFDYIGVGPVFATPTKPGRAAVGLELVRFARERLTVPFAAIGGIDLSNARQVREAGAGCLAVVRAVMEAADPRQAARLLRETSPFAETRRS